jgi:hypothetical protein
MLYVPKGMKYTTFSVESVVPDLVDHVCQKNRRKTLRAIMVHRDNAQPHNSRKSEAAVTATKLGSASFLLEISVILSSLT